MARKLLLREPFDGAGNRLFILCLRFDKVVILHFAFQRVILAVYVLS
jgi:hypothetical protein